MAEVEDVLQEEEPSPEKRRGRKFLAWFVLVLVLAAVGGIAYLLRDRIFDYIETNWFGEDEVVPVVEPEPLDPPVTDAEVTRQLAALERRLERRFVDAQTLNERLASVASDGVAIPVFEAQPSASTDAVELQLLVALMYASSSGNSAAMIDALSRALLAASELDVDARVIAAIERATAVALASSSTGHVDELRERIDQVSDLVTELLLGSGSQTTFIAVGDASQNESLVENAFSGDLPEPSEPQETPGFWGTLSEGLGSVYRIRRSEMNHPHQNTASHTDLVIQLLLRLERSREALDRRDKDGYFGALDNALNLIEDVRFDEQLDSTQLSLVSIRHQIYSLREESDIEFASDAIREALAALQEPALSPAEPTSEIAE